MLSAEEGPLRILDVGTSTGYLGMMLKKDGHYDSFLVGDLERFEFPYREEFDYIVFADVLEHLCDPTAVLRHSLPSLKKSGKVTVSVPNVAHLVIRLSLLFGRFRYMDRGILDRTHLRFFTLSSLREMLQEASCDILEIAATPVPVQMVFSVTQKRFFAPSTKPATPWSVSGKGCSPINLWLRQGSTPPSFPLSRFPMKEGSLQKPACPLCADASPVRLFESRDRVHKLPGRFTVYRCSRCSALFYEPRLTGKELSHYYPDTYGRYRHSRSLERKNYKGLRRFVLENYYRYPSEKGAPSALLKKWLAFIFSGSSRESMGKF